MIKPDKEKLIREFKLMEEFEKWAGDFYRQIALSPKIKDGEIKKAFEDTANDESRHALVVQKVINIIANNL
ncbi:MAG: hypothetical protein Q7K28_02835 [Candidatus Wildermuthbacteria bacterium]|nr:hypothetical protein [Candidatus Wildermuthbacteria bacterium]